MNVIDTEATGGTNVNLHRRLDHLEAGTLCRCSHCGSLPRIAVREGEEWRNGPPCERWPHPECEQLGGVVIKVVYEDEEEDELLKGLSWP
jgi:hypothetical protein